MKKHTEKRVETALRELLKTIDRYDEDISRILVEFELVHTNAECVESRQYASLAEGYFALRNAKEKISGQLNK